MDENSGWQIAWPGRKATGARIRNACRFVLLFAARRRQRQILAALEDHELLDIGLTREQARREAEKPFWRR